MPARLRDLPIAVFILALALARGTRAEALEAAQLVRGLAIQVALRWCLGEVLVQPGSATLLYSRLDHERSPARAMRTAAGVLAATVVGVGLFWLSNLLLLAPLAALVLALGGSRGDVLTLFLVVPAMRLGWTAWRAGVAYRLERRRERAMTPVGDAPRWRLDLMGATPPGRGHGSALVRALVQRSDAAGATVYLVCQPSNREFYRRAGFRPVPAEGPAYDGMLLMRRVAPTASAVPAQRTAARVLARV